MGRLSQCVPRRESNIEYAKVCEHCGLWVNFMQC